MATITVGSLTDVTVDGSAAGAITDVLHNYPDLPKDEILAALSAWHEGILGGAASAQSEAATAAAAALARAEQSHAAALAEAEARHAAELEARDAAHADALAQAIALKDQAAATLATAREEHAAALADVRANATAQVAAAEAARDEAAQRLADRSAGYGAEMGQLRDALTEQQALVKALGGTELGQQMQRQQRQAELEAAQAKIAEELATLAGAGS